jgi:Na+/proline symporter
MPHSSFNFVATVHVADRSVVYIVLAGFLVLLIAVGLAFRHFSKDSSDYFRAGGRATWWLAGGSVFMQGFSAWTFTGAAGAAYTAGWSVVLMFAVGCITAIVLSMGPAAWFRNLRVVTQADAIRLRYGTGMEQLYAVLQAFMGPLFGGVQLYTLAIFISALLGFDVPVIIVVLGLVVLFYSALSGAWAVLAADFIQCLILLPSALLVAVVCLVEVGG